MINTVKIKYLIDIFPKSDIQASAGEDDGKYPFYTSSQILEKRIDRLLYDSDGITMGTGGGASVNYSPVPFSTSTDCFNFKQKDGNSKYLYYCIFSILDKIDDIYFEGMGLKHLQKTDFLNEKFFYPCPATRDKIISFLDLKTKAIDEMISSEESMISKLKEMKKSLITNAVTKGIDSNPALMKTKLPYIDIVNSKWERIRIKDNTYLKGRIGWQNLRYSDFIEEGPYCITGTDFTEDARINWDTCYHVSEERYKMDVAIQVRNGDLLITKDGTVGKLAIVENLPYKACLNSHLMIIRVKNEAYNIRFLFYILKSNLLFDYLNIYKNGTVMDSLTQEMFENFQFYAPSLKQQEQIADYLDKKCGAIDKLVMLKKLKIERFQEYKKSLIYEYVTGRRTI